MKDAGMRIRVEPELREQFVDLCRKHDVPAAQVIRTFMRDFIQTNTKKTSKLASKKVAR
jgi:antitoxin component of RelBE/YafQ-DinJ toxin-antitoxin module